MKQAFALLVALLSLPSLAGEQITPTVFTRGAPELRIVERDVQDKGLLTHWRGRVHLAGNLVFEFRRVSPEERELYPDGATYFEPDAQSLAKLPTALTNAPATPSVIEILKTPQEVLVSLLGAAAAMKIVNGDRERYLIPVKLTLISLSTVIDCDRRHYSLEYESITLQSRSFVVAGAPQNMSC
jgi:hypothetical protein